jgi:hypothetical protein
LTATIASIAHDPGAVVHNLEQAHHDQSLRPLGRYGFSCVNVDKSWVGRDMIGIDAGAAILAVDNFVANNRVRSVFHRVPAVQRGLTQLGFANAGGKEMQSQRSDQSNAMGQAS